MTAAGDTISLETRVANAQSLEALFGILAEENALWKPENKSGIGSADTILVAIASKINDVSKSELRELLKPEWVKHLTDCARHFVDR